VFGELLELNATKMASADSWLNPGFHFNTAASWSRIRKSAAAAVIAVRVVIGFVTVIMYYSITNKANYWQRFEIKMTKTCALV